MDDTLRNVTFGLLAFFVIHGSLEQRARQGAERQVRESFQDTGAVRASVTSRGLFGLEANDLWAVDIYGQGQQSAELPFFVYPRSGWKGSIRHLRLHLKQFTLAGLPIRSFEADIPFAKYDLGHALYKSRLLLRATGTGPSSVQVDGDGLRTFILRKYKGTLSDVEVTFPQDQITIAGKLNVFGSLSPIVATGTLVIREGRFLDLTAPHIRISDMPLTSAAALSLLKQINPVLDVDKDLGLGDYFHIESVHVANGIVTLIGTTTIPVAKSGHSP